MYIVRQNEISRSYEDLQLEDYPVEVQRIWANISPRLNNYYKRKDKEALIKRWAAVVVITLSLISIPLTRIGKKESVPYVLLKAGSTNSSVIIADLPAKKMSVPAMIKKNKDKLVHVKKLNHSLPANDLVIIDGGRTKSSFSSHSFVNKVPMQLNRVVPPSSQEPERKFGPGVKPSTNESGVIRASRQEPANQVNYKASSIDLSKWLPVKPDHIRYPITSGKFSGKPDFKSPKGLLPVSN